MLQIDQLLQNRYRIARVLGQGGMGAVYQAQDLNLDMICVVKEMLPPPDPALVRNMALQFQREGKILASLRHMSLPRVSNYFTEQENYYLVMDLIEGRSLEKLIGETGLPESTVLQYADQLLDVLGYIHSKGILHRDIKPANIIVQPDGRVVLVDFGLVKVINTGGPVTKTLVSALTPQYAPPEQYTGNTDARSDLYSLAATLYQTLAGHPPASATDQLSGLKLQPLRQLPHLQTSVSANTEYVLMKALNLDRSARYQDAASMRAELKDGVGRVWQNQPTSTPAATQV
ncbi:MAG TPA: serine/threonine-protein kinase, partial [Anaerolineae bacterium]